MVLYIEQVLIGFYFSRLTSPMLLIAIAACLGACYIISLKNAEKKLSLMGKSIESSLYCGHVPGKSCEVAIPCQICYGHNSDHVTCFDGRPCMYQVQHQTSCSVAWTKNSPESLYIILIYWKISALNQFVGSLTFSRVRKKSNLKSLSILINDKSHP